MRILVVPSGFKESLGAKEAADVMKEGILKSYATCYCRDFTNG